MKALRAICLTLLTFAVLLFLGASAEAQLPKEGKFSSAFGWTFIGKVTEIEKDHLWIVGEYDGVIFNDAGKGFLHHASIVCPGSGHMIKGVYKGGGDCVITDADGDKAFAVWKGEGGPRSDGDLQWTGGTGKFAGLRGNNVWNGGGIGTTSQGYTFLKGEWQLP